MRFLLKAFALLIVAITVVVGIGAMYIARTGISAKAEPGPLETTIARRVRSLAIPTAARDRKNPIAASDEAIAGGRAHFADHCASCHANDGSGNTEIGRGLYPKAPDMRLPATQQLTDGELFYIIEQGVRFTGMPAWSTGTSEGERDSWHLVHFMRHLPALTEAEVAEMEQLNPKSAEEWRQEQEEREFLEGGGATPPASPPHRHPGGRP